MNYKINFILSLILACLMFLWFHFHPQIMLYIHNQNIIITLNHQTVIILIYKIFIYFFLFSTIFDYINLKIEYNGKIQMIIKYALFLLIMFIVHILLATALNFYTFKLSLIIFILIFIIKVIINSIYFVWLLKTTNIQIKERNNLKK